MHSDKENPERQIDVFRDSLAGWSHSFRVNVQWSPARIATLKAKAVEQSGPEFQRKCAAAQLAVADGRYDDAEQALISVLRQHLSMYPRNRHLYHHVMQLAISMQALNFASMVLNDLFEQSDQLHLVFDSAGKDPAANWVTVDGSGKCFIALDPEIVGHKDADHYYPHCLSSAPMWSSYCSCPGNKPGRAIMNTGDAASMPGLAYCGHKPEHILVPDVYFLDSSGYADLRRRYAKNRPDWSERQPIAFWRGATTGQRTGLMDWRSLPRIKLCQISHQRPDILDAGISAVAQMHSDDEQAEVLATNFVRGQVPEEAFLPYKYQIDIDGNTNAWPGLYQRLLSGSPVLKVTSPHGFRQWYYDRLIPWVNHIPVASDMSDLLEKIEWLRGHDAEARAIGEAGQALAESLEYDSELRRSHEKIQEAFRVGKPLVAPDS